MLLAIHIGNRAISFAVYETDSPSRPTAERLRFCAEISTKPIRSSDEYAVLLGQIFSLRGCLPETITDVILSSVVPSLTEVINAAAAQFIPVRPLVVSAGIRTGLRIKIDNPSQLGADLCALAVGASAHCTGPAVIASFDSATVLTVLSAPSELTGVVIMPGLQSAAQALDRDTALLTDIPLEIPHRVIGKNTADAMKSGLMFGCAAQIDGMVSRIAAELKCDVSDLTLLSCGRYAGRITPYCTSAFTEMPHLLFEGLLTIHEKNR
ncbi:MAG: type III pantothenate kinase [Ruminococcaceae bacterium]|nr:type III pantothenate kinase [Oscillospiraceae bacterium]